jgi:hypothetical protein
MFAAQEHLMRTMQRLLATALTISFVILTRDALAAAPSPCVSVTPGSWINVPFGSAHLWSVFEATIEVTPTANNIDFVIGLSRERASAFSDISITTRLGQSGYIEALNGNAYARSPVTYTAGVRYRLRFVADIPNRVFSVYVTPSNGTEILLGSNFAFRTAAGEPVRLENWVITTTSGEGQACKFGAPSFTAVALAGWHNSAFLAQSNTLMFEWDATPSTSTLDTVMALSDGPGDEFRDFACLVRFGSQTGHIEARNGESYAPSIIPFAAGTTYRFRLFANLSTDTYDVFVTAENGIEQTLATGFAFRTEQKDVLRLNNFGAITDSPEGSTQIANFRLTAFTDAFNGLDGLITDEFASTGDASLMWLVTSGQLWRASNRGAVNAPVFRMHSKSNIEGDYRVAFDLWLDKIGSQPDTNGVHLALRHMSQRDVYYVSVNRADQTAIIKRKVPCGPSNGGTYVNLSNYARFTWQLRVRQRLSVAIRTRADGSVFIEMFNDETQQRILSAVDRGDSNRNWSESCDEGGRYDSANYPPLRAGGAVGIRSDNSHIRIDNVKITPL